MTTDYIQELLTQLKARKTELDTLVRSVVEDIESVERTLELLSGDPTVDDELRHGNTRPHDIAGCRTQMDAIRKMAIDNDGILIATPASKVIQASGLSKGKIRSIRSTLYHRLGNDDDWEQSGTGEFRYLGTIHSAWSNMVSTAEGIRQSTNVSAMAAGSPSKFEVRSHDGLNMTQLVPDEKPLSSG